MSTKRKTTKPQEPEYLGGFNIFGTTYIIGNAEVSYFDGDMLAGKVIQVAHNGDTVLFSIHDKRK